MSISLLSVTVYEIIYLYLYVYLSESAPRPSKELIKIE